MKPAFDLNFAPCYGETVTLSNLVRRVTCENPGAFTFKGTNSFIIGRGRVAIVDPGPDDAMHLAALLRGIQGEKVSHIIVTHSHMDHSSLVAKLKLATGAVTYAGKLDSPSDRSIQLDASIDRRFQPDVILTDGDVLDGEGWSLQAISTPGHLSNHICLNLPEEQALLSGDHVMAWATTVVAPPEGHMGDYLASLHKLLQRRDEIYYPAHGPERQNPARLVRQILEHREMREAAIYDRVKAGKSDLQEIVADIYTDLDFRLHGAAALSTLAHLQHLMDQHLIEQLPNGTFKVAS